MRKNPTTAFITGGASGIGYAMAEIFLKRSVKVAVFDLNISDEVKSKLSQLAKTNHTKLTFHQIDVTDAVGLNNAIQSAAGEIGSPEFALNCAGMQHTNKFMDMQPGEFERVIKVNLFGSKNFAAGILPLMQTGGHLAFIASLAGLVPNYTYSSYSASKYAVVGLASVLRIEQKERGIDVSVICPPEILTPMVEKELLNMHPITKELKAFADTIPLDDACAYIFKQLKRYTAL